MTTLVIPGTPIPQPRQRHTIVCGHVQNYTPTRDPVNAFKATCRLTWHNHCPDTLPIVGPVYLSADFVLPKPQSKTLKRDAGRRIWCDSKPDVDNLLKSLLDALTGLAWQDDKQIAMIRASKTYAASTESPHVEVTILAAKPVYQQEIDP
jgi:Holliday junction resolvase RusA-like endonuclease